MKSLADKLGLRPGMEIALLNAPGGYESLLGPVSVALFIHRAIPAHRLVWLQVFTDNMAELGAQFPALAGALQPAGQLWVSWRKGQKAPGALNEDGVRAIGLAHGVVDVKVVSVDSTWSGLKFVFRLQDRKGAGA